MNASRSHLSSSVGRSDRFHSLLRCAAVTITLFVATVLPLTAQTSLPLPKVVPSGASAIVLSPATISFGVQVTGTTSNTQAIALSNTGTIDLSLQFTLTGANTSDFMKTSNCGPTVAAGHNCSIYVAFQPQAVGWRTASLEIVNSADLTSPRIVSLSGDSIPTLQIPIFSTGQLGGGGGTADPHYTTNIASAPKAIIVLPNTLPKGSSNSTTSQWISLSSDASTTYSAPVTYSTTFSLAGLDPSTAVLTGSLASNAPVTVVLNGTTVTGLTLPSSGAMHPFRVSAGFISGTNTISFAIGDSTPGARALQVSIQGTSTSALATGAPPSPTPTDAMVQVSPASTSSTNSAGMGVYYATQFASIQAAVTAAGTSGLVVIPPTYSGTDSFTNPNNIQVLDYRTSQQTVYNAHSYGCKGDGVTDDTACLQALFASLTLNPFASLYIPGGKYLVNGTLRAPIATTLYGDGWNQTFLVETNPTADLLIVTSQNPNVFGFAMGPMISDLTLAGEGPFTDGNLLINAAGGNATFNNVGFLGHGGRGMLIESERGVYTNIHSASVRQTIVATTGIAVNESYFQNFTFMEVGHAQNLIGIGPSGDVCYSINSSNGVFPATGSLQQDMHAAFDLSDNITNVQISGGSIKPTTCVAGIHIRGSSSTTLDHLYIEGYNNGSVNPSIIYGGGHEKTTLVSSLSNTQLTFDISDGKWFSPYVGNLQDLPQLGPAAFVLRPPDYQVGSTAPSSLGGNVKQGDYEIVDFGGIVHDTQGSKWHVHLTSRGYQGTAAKNWPAGTIMEDGFAFPTDYSGWPGPLEITNSNLNSVASAIGYSVVCDNMNEKTCGEIVLGVVPDQFFVPGSTNIKPIELAAVFGGNNTMFCWTGPDYFPKGFLDAYSNALVDLRGVGGTTGFMGTGGSFASSTAISLVALGGCQITREMFANGVGTVLTYYDASGAISYWGPSNNPPMGYSMGTINNSPAAFVPTQGAYSIAGTSGTASSTPSWQYTVSASGLQQTTNGTQKLNVDSNGNVSTPGSVEASRFVGAVTTVAFSETPVFDLSQGDQAITLSGDVSASEAINIAQGQAVTFRVCQDSVGGRSFKWPLNFQAATAVSQNASACTIQKFESFDGTTLSSVGGASMILP